MEKKELRVTAKAGPADIPAAALQALMRGERDASVERRIASQPIYVAVRPADAGKARFSPVAIDAEEIRALSTDAVTPDSVLKKLEKSAKQRGRFGEEAARSQSKGHPSERPSDK